MRLFVQKRSGRTYSGELSKEELQSLICLTRYKRTTIFSGSAIRDVYAVSGYFR